MKYIFVSSLIHLALAVFLLKTKTYEASGGKEGESPSSESETVHFISNQTPTEQITTQKKIIETKNTINLLDIKAIEKEKLEKEKKLEEEKKAKLEKEIKEKAAKEKEKPKAKLKAENDKKKTSTNKQSINPNSKGRGNGIGDTKGNGKGIDGDGDGLGSAKKRTDEQIAEAISAIQRRIMDYWHPPEEFAARSDINIEIELFLDDKGNILSYKLLNQQDTPAYKAVAASVIRVLHDPNVVPLPVSKHKKFNNIILKFCPRDVL